MLIVSLLFDCICRPIVGYANFCPYSLNNNDHVTDDFIISVAKHEILHALVYKNIQ